MKKKKKYSSNDKDREKPTEKNQTNARKKKYIREI